LELETMKQLEQADNKEAGSPDKASDTSNPKMQKLQLQKEQAEIEHAIAMSLTLDLERKKMQDAEDRELEEAIRLSEQEYESSKKKPVEPIKQELPPPKKEEPQITKPVKEVIEEPKTELPKVEEPVKTLPALPVMTTSIATSPIKFEDKEEEKKEVFTKKKPGKVVKDTGITPSDEIAQMLGGSTVKAKPDLKKKESMLPPLKADNKYEAKPVEVLFAEQQDIAKKLEELNTLVVEKPKGENLEDRKKRLMAQRDLILAKKKAEREAELKKYEADQKTGVTPTNPIDKSDDVLLKSTSLVSPVDDNEVKKRKEIYQKLKEQQ